MTRILSLFTGAGGLDLAACSVVEWAWPSEGPAWVVAHSEVEPSAQRVLSARWPGTPNLGDVTTINWSSARSLVGDRVDVIVGGFPCQDISHAGLGAGIKEGTRSGLWYRFADAIRVLRPRLVLLENVAAIVGAGRGHDAVLGSLAALGFDAEWGVLRASDVGACHQRARWFCVAYDPRRTGGGQAIEHDGRRTQEANGSSVSDKPDRDPARTGPSSVDLPPPPDHLFPTPLSRDWKDSGNLHLTVPAHRMQDTLPRVIHTLTLPHPIEMLPSPSVNGNRSAGESQDRRNSPPLGRVVQWSRETETESAPGKWGKYAPAIQRWEVLMNKNSPSPVNHKNQLSPEFVEWMMGWPDGWTNGDGPLSLSRNQRLKMLGNGVVPQQAAEAYRQLLLRANLVEPREP